VLAASERLEEAERILRDVIDRAEQHGRPLLVAQAGRDLAHVLERRGQPRAAIEVACVARARFRTLGADVQIRRLDRLISTLRSRRARPR
jgi:hypothetical protein